MINQILLKNSLDKYLESNETKSIDITSNRFVDIYINFIKSGSDSISNNSILTFNRDILVNGLKNEFNRSFKSNSFFKFSNLNMSLQLFWNSSTLDIKNIPPQFSILQSNIIIFSGSFIEISKLESTNSNLFFIDKFSNYLVSHLKTLKGSLIGLNIKGDPLVINWNGYL